MNRLVALLFVCGCMVSGCASPTLYILNLDSYEEKYLLPYDGAISVACDDDRREVHCVQRNWDQQYLEMVNFSYDGQFLSRTNMGFDYSSYSSPEFFALRSDGKAAVYKYDGLKVASASGIETVFSLSPGEYFASSLHTLKWLDSNRIVVIMMPRNITATNYAHVIEVDVQKHQEKVVTVFGGGLLPVRLSPDGNLLAYQTGWEAGVVDMPACVKRPFKKQGGFDPMSWSPDSRELIVLRHTAEDKTYKLCKYEEQSFETIPTGGRDYDFMLHAGDKLVAGEKKGTGQYTLHILDRNTGKRLKSISTSGVRIWRVCDNGKLLVGYWGN